MNKEIDCIEFAREEFGQEKTAFSWPGTKKKEYKIQELDNHKEYFKRLNERSGYWTRKIEEKAKEKGIKYEDLQKNQIEYNKIRNDVLNNDGQISSFRKSLGLNGSHEVHNDEYTKIRNHFRKQVDDYNFYVNKKDRKPEHDAYYNSLREKLAHNNKETEKTAVMDPKVLFSQALIGAVSGAIAGSRRSLDNATLQGVTQGAAIGALGGMLGGQIHSSPNPSNPGQAGAIIGGALSGYFASRGPLGKEQRPQIHIRLDKNENKQTTNEDKKQEKTASDSTLGQVGELAGLSILAAPAIKHLAGKHMSEDNAHKAELAGLGVLAAPYAYSLGKKAKTGLSGLAKRFAKK